MISIIVAIANNGVIGNNNSLPWHLPVDLKYFRRITTGHTIVMGRRNYEDIGRALPNRRNIVLTHAQDYIAQNCEVTHSIEEIIKMTEEEDETFIIGGAEIYKEFLPLARNLYITHIDADVAGDVYFPDYNRDKWLLKSEEIVPSDDNNSLACRFCIYQKID